MREGGEKRKQSGGKLDRAWEAESQLQRRRALGRRGNSALLPPSVATRQPLEEGAALEPSRLRQSEGEKICAGRGAASTSCSSSRQQQQRPASKQKEGRKRGRRGGEGQGEEGDQSGGREVVGRGARGAERRSFCER